MTPNIRLAVAVLAGMISTTTYAQFAKPDDAVRYRQSSLFIMSQHFNRIAAMANGRTPYDAATAAANAEIVASMSKLPWAGFGPGTDKISQRAKPTIWTEQVKFKELQDNLMTETSKLQAAAKTNNLDNLKAAFSATAAACKACHDAYRN